MKYLRIIRAAIPVFAACALLATFISAFASWQLIRKAEKTTGTIVASATELNDDGETLYRPAFEFAVDGQDYSVTPLSYVSPNPGDVGTKVPVLYDPGNPSSARINSFSYNWLVSAVTFLIASFLGLIHFAIAMFGKRFWHVDAKRGITNKNLTSRKPTPILRWFRF